MADKLDRTPSEDLVINELDQPYAVTEDEMDSVSFAACCCTCDIPFTDAAAVAEPTTQPSQ